MRWVDGDLQWIPVTLATLKPKTSPFLSRIHLGFNGPMRPGFPHPFSVNATLQRLGSNLQRIAAELIRIEHEYEGAVDLVVSRAPEFARLDTHNVRGSRSIVHSFVADSSIGPSVLGLSIMKLWDPQRAPFPFAPRLAI